MPPSVPKVGPFHAASSDPLTLSNQCTFIVDVILKLVALLLCHLSSGGNSKPVTGFSVVPDKNNEIRKEYLGTGN